MGAHESAKSDRTKAREAFFIEFAKAIRSRFPKVPLIVTGGFRTRQGMESALTEGGCDMTGLGRPAALNPSLPTNIILNKEVKDEDAKLYARKIQAPWVARKLAPPAIGAGAESVSSDPPLPVCVGLIADMHVIIVLVQHADRRPGQAACIDCSQWANTRILRRTFAFAAGATSHIVWRLMHNPFPGILSLIYH